MSDVETLALSLVSHTNVGKTSLARTLLRRDVGSVFDQAHVTDVSEAWTLLESDGARLLLWDTPGFGDTARLLRRMRAEGNPVGWFLHQVWDRATDRALWCGQEAVRNVRDQSDVVIYLVSAAEHPDDAGYVALELDLLGWLGKPVVVLLNQTGPAGDDRPELLDAWTAHVTRWDSVRSVLPLDAFARCWVQEGTFLEHVRDALPEARRPLMQRFVDAWNARNLEAFGEAVDALAALVHETAVDTEPLPGLLASGAEKKKAMDRLARRVEARTRALLDRLLALAGLEGASAARVADEIRDFVVSGEPPLGVKKGAIWGGVLSGAATGVAADLLTGGLSFGGGAVVGAVLGALGGAGLAKGFQLVASRKAPAVRWSQPFLSGLLHDSLLRYLAVAQHGRGGGEFHEGDAPSAWRDAVGDVLRERKDALSALWTSLLRDGAGGLSDDAAARRVQCERVHALVDELLRAVLVRRHPAARALLAR
ncbi:MAG: DUF3482 domain-containing protein [Planctomycetes bacterium]|nr:DUF3482 domain-containing protein [Planctomycetota bacterium]